ncbi:MAG TPA: IS1595 family transposase, partial [Terriglobales bacterium]|nr:IS1595 family transposase [Terriglobales bacterium]
TKHKRRQFSVKVGTVMEDSPLPLSVWLPAMWMIANDRNGISSWEIHRALGITQKSAWFLLHRIRLGMQDAGHGGGKLGGRVEVDETFIGGKARNMHSRVRKAKGIGPGGEGKTIVLGMLERGGAVRTAVVPNREGATLQPIMREHVKRGAKVMTDEHAGYNGLEDDFLRGVINHAVEYVNGSVHTNGMENYWSLVKRGLNGTYIAVEPFHLFRYLDEQSFRYNNRKDGNRVISDAERFSTLAGQLVGKRLMYSALTGKEGEKPSF